MGQFDVDVWAQDDRVVVAVHGDLDIATGPQLAEVLERELPAQPRRGAYVDLTHTGFLDSSGSRLLLGTAKRARTNGVDFAVICPEANRRVMRVLTVLGLTEAFQVREILPT